MNKITILAKIAEILHLNEFVQYIKVETNKNKLTKLTNKLIKQYPDTDQSWIKHVVGHAILNNQTNNKEVDYDRVEMISQVNCGVLLGLQATNGLLPLVDISTTTAPVGQVFPMVYKEVESDDHFNQPQTSCFVGAENIQTKRMVLEIVSKTYECRTRRLQTSLPIELSQDLAQFHDLDVNKEILNVLIQEIKDELVAEIIHCITHDNPVTELDFELNGTGTLISQASQYIHKTRMHIKPEYVVVNNTNYSLKDVNVTQTALVSPVSDVKDLIIIGNEDNSHVKSMYHFMLNNILCCKVVNPETFQPTLQFMVRYGIVENNKALLVRVKQKTELLQE